MVSDVITNYARNRTALLIGGSTTIVPSGMMIGTGSSTVSVTDTTLTTASDRQAFTSIPTFPTSTSINFQSDWNSVEMSGTSLTEFGIAGSGVGTNGSMWSIHVTPAIVFDGTNELRVEEVWEIL